MSYSKNPEKSWIVISIKILSSTSVLNIDNNNVSWAPNQHIRMISVESRGA